MFESLVITLREGIEAALVIGIILTYLKRTGKENLSKSVYIGVVLAILGSIGVAYAFQTLGIDADNEYFEGITMIVASLAGGFMSLCPCSINTSSNCQCY